VTQIQVGCLAHCHGRTTLDTSGLTLAQVEQLLNELHVPTPPTVTAVPAAGQSATQQTSEQSENGAGPQLQIARQANGTIQIVVTPAPAPADGGTGAAAVNQTAQGVVQLQVGCIFYCSGTEQTQRSDQSTATVQTVDGSAASTVNTVSRVVYQVQVGCIAWCDDAVESQTATGSDSSVVSTAPPPEATAPVATDPGAAGLGGAGGIPAPASDPAPLPPAAGGRTRHSGGAAVRVRGDGLGTVVSSGSQPVLVSVATSRIVQAELPEQASHRVSRPGRRAGRHHRTTRSSGAAVRIVQRAAVAAVPSIEPETGAAQSTLELSVVLALAALGIVGWRRVR